MVIYAIKRPGGIVHGFPRLQKYWKLQISKPKFLAN